MPRIKKAPTSQRAQMPTNALIASAHRYTGRAPRIYAPSKDWQKRCYQHYGQCGEARFAARYFGHAMSRATLFIADAKGVAATSGAPRALLDELFSGVEGQAEMLEMAGVHLVVAGECYLVGREVDGVDIWEVVSVMEVESGAGGWQILSPEDGTWMPLQDDDVVIRVWIPKPDRRWEADSPFRSLLPVLDEIEWITRYIHAQTTSRLTGAGILVFPEGMTFPPPPPVDGKEQELSNDADAIMTVLGEVMSESLKGNGAASEQVPVVITAPAEAIGDIKHLTFWTPLDENARDMRKDAIHRFALGMDLPPEMVLGMGSNEGTGGGSSNGVSHWGAWMIEEQAIKLHIEPMLDRLCAALTGYYLRPLVDTDQRIKADTSTLRLRPDRSAESLELADRGWLKMETAVVENGFSADDIPDDDQRREWLLMKLAGGSATPEQVNAALKLLGVDLGVDMSPESDEAPVENAPPPSLDEHPARPRTPLEHSIPTLEALVLRALERAGNRLRNIHQIRTSGPSFEAHTHIEANGTATQCLEDAWATAPIVLSDLGQAEAERVITVLNDYCGDLMKNQASHTRAALTTWCEERL